MEPAYYERTDKSEVAVGADVQEAEAEAEAWAPAAAAQEPEAKGSLPSACLACLVCCGGPIMFIIGLVYLVRADKDLRGKSVASYTSAISHWQQDATGATSFFNAFGSASGLWLNVTLAGGNQFPSMFSVPMTFGSQQVAISDTGADAAKPYTPQYYLNGQSALFPSVWSTTSVSFALWGANLTALPTVTLPAVRCRNTESCPTCGGKFSSLYYYRVYSALASVTLQVALPVTCSTGPCAPVALVADGCSASYADQPPVLISRSDFLADGGSCKLLISGLGLITQPVQPVLTVRSTADPRVAAAQLTQCSLQFPRAAKSRKLAVGLTAAGSALLGCGLFSLCFAKKCTCTVNGEVVYERERE